MNEKNEVDIFRDTPVRYMGYANEVGEAFRSLIPKSIVWFSYVVASGYVLADTVSSTAKAYRNMEPNKRNQHAIVAATDTLLWQSFASVIIPGFTINRICAGIQYAQKAGVSKKLRSKWIPTIIGLTSIPLIIRPIDDLVESTMDITYRKWLNYHPKMSSHTKEN